MNNIEQQTFHNGQNDHDLLIRIDTRLQDLIRDNNDFKSNLSKLENKKCDKDEVNEKFNGHKQDIATQLSDHEKRMRRVERFVYIAIGALTLLQFILNR